jgi:hypothetical protein
MSGNALARAPVAVEVRMEAASMGRTHRRRVPCFEPMERRAVPSVVGSVSSHAVPINNEILNPAGQPTRHELRRQAFRATFSGPYVIGPGRFTSQASQVFIRGAGTSTAFLHGDILLKIATPTDPDQPPTGALTMYDRNANNGSQLGLRLTGSRQGVDRHGRPNRFAFTVDDGASGGAFTQASGQGTLQVRYFASGRNSGTAQVLATGRIYTLGTTNNLRNSDIDP